MICMGKILGCQGAWGESLAFYMKALTQYHSTLGQKHFRVANLYGRIADVYIQLDRPSDAR